MIKTPLIWNITNKCFYSCSFCCVNANSSNKDISFDDKLKIIENLDSKTITIDVSGGEPLIDLENFEILKILAKKFKRENISVTPTGKGLKRVNLNELKNYISSIGFTYDYPRDPSPNRPPRYNEHNLQIAREASTHNLESVANIPLTKSNVNPDIIKQLYSNLHDANIPQLLLIRFSESGKGFLSRDLTVSQEEINKTLRIYKSLESEYIYPKININPFVRGKVLGKIFTSLNISNQGLLLSNPWSYDITGKPKSSFILGDITKYKLSELANANIYQRFFTQLKRNMLR